MAAELTGKYFIENDCRFFSFLDKHLQLGKLGWTHAVVSMEITISSAFGFLWAFFAFLFF